MMKDGRGMILVGGERQKGCTVWRGEPTVKQTRAQCAASATRGESRIWREVESDVVEGAVSGASWRSHDCGYSRVATSSDHVCSKEMGLRVLQRTTTNCVPTRFDS